MKTIDINLGADVKRIEIVPFYDLHIGSPHCKYDIIQKRIEYVKNTENAYAVLGGDLINNSTRDSVGDCYSEPLTPQQQINKSVELFMPIANKILGVTTGNHERRTLKKHGVDITQCMCAQLGIVDRYDPVAGLIFLSMGARESTVDETSKQPNHNIGQPIMYTIYFTHGDGNGGRTLGGKVNGVERRTNIIDADIIMCGHTHQSFITYESRYIVQRQKRTIKQVDTMLVNMDATIGYEGYAETVGMKPTALRNPRIVLDGTKHAMVGIL